MSKTSFDKIAKGLDDAIAYAAGDSRTARVAAPLDVAAIRGATGKSQAQFAASYGLTVDSVQEWEAGRRQPRGAARVLLSLIQAEPKTIERLVANR